MVEWIARYWVEWVFGILGGALILAYRSLAKKVKREIQEQEALKEGMRSLLKRQIIEDCRQRIRDGEVDPTDRETILDMYDCYQKLGGNGSVTKIKDEMMQLRTK